MRPFLVPLLLLAACGNDRAATANLPRREQPLVCTTTYPLQYCVSRIAGDLASVECVVPVGRDPLHWRPSREQIARMQSADLIVMNGATAESWRFQASLPGSRVVDTAKGFAEQFLRVEGVTHSHGGGETHTHSETDPHTWVDPRLLKQQAVAALESLIRRLPQREPELRDNYRALAADLDDLDARFGKLEAVAKGITLATCGDVYRYLARRLGCSVHDLGISSDVPESDAAMRVILKQLGDVRPRLMVWTMVPDAALRERVAKELAIESVAFLPCAAMPATGEDDYMAVMRANLDRLARALGE